MLRVKLYVMLLCLAIVSCGTKAPKGLLSESEMEQVLYEYHLARTFGMQQRDSSHFRAIEYTEAVLARHNISRQKFDESLLWYTQHTKFLYPMYERINKKLDNEATAHGLSSSNTKRYSEMATTGDTANVWQGAAYYLLANNNQHHHVSFNINADTTFHPFDRFVFHFTSRFVQEGGPKNAFVSLSVVYNNDSVSIATRKITNDGDTELALNANNIPIKAVKGFIYHDTDWNKKPRLLFITNLALVRTHRVYRKITIDLSQRDTTHTEFRPDPLASPSEQLRSVGHEQRLRPIPKRREATIAPAEKL